MYRYGSAGMTTAVTVALPVLVWMSIYMAAGTAGDHPPRREVAIQVASATDTATTPPSRHIPGWLMDYIPQHNTSRAEKGWTCAKEEETPAEHIFSSAQESSPALWMAGKASGLLVGRIYVVYVPARPGASSSTPPAPGERDPVGIVFVVVAWITGLAILVGMGADN